MQAFSAWLQTPVNIEDEISESESDSDSSRQADNWDSSSLDSGNEHSDSGEDMSQSKSTDAVVVCVQVTREP